MYPFTEHVTNKHQIITVVIKNKTYCKHSHLLNEGIDEGVADYHCSLVESGADLSMHHTIGDEFIW